MNRQSLKEKVDELLSQQKCDEVENLLSENREVVKSDRELLQIYYLLPVCATEREAGEHTLFTKVSSVGELVERETRLKFYLRRAAFDILDDEDEFCDYCIQKRVSLPELFIVAYCNAVHREKVQGFIQRKIAEGKLRYG